MHLVAHLQNRTSLRKSQVLPKSHQANARQSRHQITNKQTTKTEGRSANTRLAQWGLARLIEGSFFYHLLCYVDSSVLRNPPLRQAWNRWH